MTSPKTARGRTVKVREENYRVHDRRPFTPWRVLVKVDANEEAYDTVYRTGWEDGGEVEIFTLLPVEGCGDTPLVQIRIYTQANSNEGKASVPNPEIITQCCVPAFVHVKPKQQRILITLLCRLEARPEEHRLIVEPDPEIDLEFLQEEVEEEREEHAVRTVFSAIEARYDEQMDQRATQHTFEEWVEFGKRAYGERAYEEARDFFDLAARRDSRHEAQAVLWLALAHLQEQHLVEAERALMLMQEIAAGDSGSVAMRVLAFWCRMCQCPTLDDFLQFTRTLLQVPQKDDPLDLLELLAKQWKRTPERVVFDTMMAYLRGNYEACLQLLAGLGEQAREAAWNRWLATLWRGMTHASLDHPDIAQDAIREVVADGMPQALLLPFRWFKATRPAYFADYIEPLFVAYHLPFVESWGPPWLRWTKESES